MVEVQSLNSHKYQKQRKDSGVSRLARPPTDQSQPRASLLEQ